MIDKTTVGVTAEQDEVEAVLHNLCGYHLAEPDPLFRYNVLTREQVLYEALAAAIKRERGRALADMTTNGHTLTQIASMTNLETRQRVQRLIAISKAAEEAAAEVQAASREFHERLAAVEATLDEVVSGLIPAAAPTGELPVVTPTVVTPPVELVADPPASEGFPQDYPTIYAEAVTNAFPVLPAARESADDRAGARSEWSMAELSVEELAVEVGDRPKPDVMLEPTQSMPALRPLLHPTKEMPPQEESLPWWRRNRDTGAA